ncbi:ARC6/PARC6 family protein [Microbacterium sp. G2-8]|uniref:ARC6/PARC6 family protein n=1 Tax=Microbacterium sp. G2-8 TaxID=2842454 RepID=UPI001C8AB569|nr:ARC6/PARC6 family protein [Microbacterium sp. G2-8]
MTFTPRSVVIGAACVAILAVTGAAIAFGSVAPPVSGDDAALSPAASDPVPSATAEVRESASAPPAAPAATPVATPGPSPTAAPRTAPPTPEPTAAPVTGDLEEDAVRDLIDSALLPSTRGDKGNRVGLIRQLSDAVAGSYLAELEAQDAELAENGWTLEGDPVVESVEILSHHGRDASVRACIDSSDVVMRDDAGDPVGSLDARSVRAASVFDFVREKGVWRITARSFPDDPTC